MEKKYIKIKYTEQKMKKHQKSSVHCTKLTKFNNNDILKEEKRDTYDYS